MTDITLVVEGRSDVILLRGLLGDLTNCSFRYYAGEGKVSLASLARNILVHEGGPLLIVMDADTLSPSKAEEESAMVRILLRRFSAASDSDVVAFLPTLEVIFFEAPGVLARRFGSDQIKEPVIERGLYRPNDTLGELLSLAGLSKENYFRTLTSQDIEELRQGAQVRKLISAVEALAASTEASDMTVLTSPEQTI
jgi:hypothetical protein